MKPVVNLVVLPAYAQTSGEHNCECANVTVHNLANSGYFVNVQYTRCGGTRGDINIDPDNKELLSVEVGSTITLEANYGNGMFSGTSTT